MIIYQHIDNSEINVRANPKLDNPEKLDAHVRVCVCVCVCVLAKGIDLASVSTMSRLYFRTGLTVLYIFVLFLIS